MPEIIDIKDNKEKFMELANHSALTITGITIDSIPNFVDWLKEHTKLKNERVYTVTGTFMNRIQGLTKDNAYKDDLTFAIVDLDDIENVEAIVYPRFSVGGRWLDDIIANNLQREGYDAEYFFNNDGALIDRDEEER